MPKAAPRKKPAAPNSALVGRIMREVALGGASRTFLSDNITPKPKRKDLDAALEYLIFHKTIEVDTSIDVDEDSDADDSPFYVRYGSNN